jgi:hypothetical protein
VPHSPLSSETDDACSDHCQGPWVASFLCLGPKAILGRPELDELSGLDRVDLGVLILLVSLGVSIPADISQECVVGGRGKERDWVELARTPEEDGEREVDQSVSEVAGIIKSVLQVGLGSLAVGRIRTWDGAQCSRHPHG